jgi:hypothetical protein
MLDLLLLCACNRMRAGMTVSLYLYRISRLFRPVANN